MAQYTSLSVLGLPGQVHTFSAKADATILLQKQWNHKTNKIHTHQLKSYANSMVMRTEIKTLDLESEI